jgi:hypothetical protein
MPAINLTKEQYCDLLVAVELAAQRYGEMGFGLNEPVWEAAAERFDKLGQSLMGEAKSFKAGDVVEFDEADGFYAFTEALEARLAEEDTISSDLVFVDSLLSRLAERTMDRRYTEEVVDQMDDERYHAELDAEYDALRLRLAEEGLDFLEIAAARRQPDEGAPAM